MMKNVGVLNAKKEMDKDCNAISIHLFLAVVQGHDNA